MRSTTLPSSLVLIPLKLPSQFRAKKCIAKFPAVCVRLDQSQNPVEKPLNLSVLRFTLGIRGLDESYLPRWIGYGFGSLLLLNHFVGSNSASEITPAQFRTDALGLSLAAFSIAVPYLGKFLKGVIPKGQATTLPEGTEQIFMFSKNVSDAQKEDLAWATYVLLRNTSTTAVLLQIRGELCLRGYWNKLDSVSSEDTLGWFKEQIERIGLSELRNTLYFPQISDSGIWDILPKGTQSVLIKPVVQVSDSDGDEMEENIGYVLLVSSLKYAYGDKDRLWIGAIANKFRRKSICID